MLSADHAVMTVLVAGQRRPEDHPFPDHLADVAGTRSLGAAATCAATAWRVVLISWLTSPSSVRAAGSAGCPAAGPVHAGPASCPPGCRPDPLTSAEDAVRARFAKEFALAGQVPEYRDMFDREGVDGPADVLIVGDEDSVAKQLDRIGDTGVTDLMLAPVGTAKKRAGRLRSCLQWCGDLAQTCGDSWFRRPLPGATPAFQAGACGR